MQSGPNLIVEVDIVMDEHTSLRQAHDVSQQLQDKLETLPGVERAYVHVDYESTHTPVCRSQYAMLLTMLIHLIGASQRKMSLVICNL